MYFCSCEERGESGIGTRRRYQVFHVMLFSRSHRTVGILNPYLLNTYMNSAAFFSYNQLLHVLFSTPTKRCKYYYNESENN